MPIQVGQNKFGVIVTPSWLSPFAENVRGVFFEDTNLIRRLSLFAAMLVLSLGFMSCSEETANETGLILLPDEAIGGLPVDIDLGGAITALEEEGAIPEKSVWIYTYVGNMSDYDLTTLMAYSVDIPDDATIHEATLQLYAAKVLKSGQVPFSVHLLDGDYTYDQTTELFQEGWAAWEDGVNYDDRIVAQTVYDPAGYDTLSTSDTLTLILDKDLLYEHFAAAQNGIMSFAIVNDGASEAAVGFISDNMDASLAIASRLQILYSEAGSGDTLLVDRRVHEDATLAKYNGTVPQDLLVVGENPARQVFFNYDFSSIPKAATINKAELILKLERTVVLDSLVAVSFTTDNPEFTSTSGLSSSKTTRIPTGAEEINLDVTSTVQSMILDRSLGEDVGYLGLGIYSNLSLGGYFTIYPPTYPDSTMRPQLKVTYSAAAGAPFPLRSDNE